MQITGEDHINPVINLVRGMTNDGDEQLTILARALVVGCRSCRVGPGRAIEALTELFEAEDMPLVRLDQ